MADNTNPFDFEFHTQYDEEGMPLVQYTPFTDGRVVGFKIEELGKPIGQGRVEYLYFNPSDNLSVDDVPNVFVYHGTEGDPAYDGAVHHYTVLEDEGA